ncbi:MAG: Bax inhibitor-1/YccA family protein [Planctomycetes bacterium]|nr:Bax inhibitor-1/YccA family protein [Planctomycetota bacterium]
MQYQQQNPYQDPRQVDHALATHANAMVRSEATAKFFSKIYATMVTGLVVTGGVGFAVSKSSAMMEMIYSGPAYIVLTVVLIAACFGLSALLWKLPSGVGAILFYLFAALEGVALSAIFIVYDMSTVIAPTFLICGAMFAGLSIYGMTTKRDLGPIGTGALMVVFGLILVSIVNAWFLKMEGLSLVLSYGIVALISIVTAWDTQKLRNYILAQDPRNTSAAQQEMNNKIIILGAFELFLDFIILFIHMLRIVAASRD